MGEPPSRSKRGAGYEPPDPSGTWRDRLALLVLGLLLTQSIIRLTLMATVAVDRQTLAIYHLAMLTALAALAVLLLRVVAPTRLGRVLVAAVLAAATFLLCASDLLALASARLGDTVFSFAFLADNWCASSIDIACVARYPLVFLAAGGFLLAATVIFYLVYGALRFRALKLLAAAEGLPGIRRVGAIALLSTIVVACAGWSALAPLRWRNEPIHALFLAPFELGPSELLLGASPPYRAPPTPGVKPRPLVLILVDSMRADMVGLAPGQPTATPFLRSLAASGRLHEIAPAYAVCPNSYCGILGILMSASWADMQSRNGPTLTQALGAEGYRTSFVLSGVHSRFVNIRDHYGADLAHYSDDDGFDDRTVIARLDRLRFEDPDRSFLFVHLMSAHLTAIRFYPENAWQVDLRLSADMLREQVGLPKLAEYHAQGVRQADEVIRRIFAALERKGMLRDALVVISADHGERIGERGLIGHLGSPDPAVSRIPLLIYDAKHSYPERPVASAIDIAPTLLNAIGASIPPAWSGEPLQDSSGRTAVAVDSRTVLAAAFRHRDGTSFYACDRDTGAETAWRADTTPESGRARADAIAAGRRALKSLPRRQDKGECLR